MLSGLISPADIKISLESFEKEECFAELLEVIVANGAKIDRREALNALIEREDKMSTAVFPHVAVPHAISNSIGRTAISIGISKKGIEFEPLDTTTNPKNPIVNIIFEILFEEQDTELHLHILRDVLALVSNPDFFEQILKANSSQEVYNIIEALEY